MSRIPLIGPSATAFSLAVSAQQSLNCYLETVDGAGEKNKLVLRGRPGMRLFKDLTVNDAAAHPVRGLFSGGGRLFVAAGTKEFEVDVNGATVGSVHTITNPASLPVQLIPNSNQLLIVSGGTVYCDSGAGPVAVTFAALSGQVTTLGTSVLREPTPNSVTGNTDSFDVGMVGQTITIDGTGYTVASITNPNLLTLTGTAGVQSFKDWSSTPVLTATNGAFIDGYYLVGRPSSRQWNISNLLDGVTWSGLDFAIKEGFPDNILAVWTEPPLVYLLGTETLEVWRNTGAASFPFERVDGGFAHIGLAATWSMASIMGKLHMLAGGTYGQTIAVRMEGATPVRISTHAVEEAFRTQAFPSQGVAYPYMERGHWFWVINFTGGNSWVYDATESARLGEPQWHERAAFSAGAFSQYVPWFHTFIPEWGGNGMHIVGDGASGKLYEISSDYFDDQATDIRCVRALAYVYREGKRVYHERIEFELETGTAGTPPVLTLDWSDDRGQTFGTGRGAGTFRTLGPGVTGVYSTRYWCVGLGSSRGRIYRITIQGQGRVALIDASLEISEGVS